MQIYHIDLTDEHSPNETTQVENENEIENPNESNNQSQSESSSESMSESDQNDNEETQDIDIDQTNVKHQNNLSNQNEFNSQLQYNQQSVEQVPIKLEPDPSVSIKNESQLNNDIKQESELANNAILLQPSSFNALDELSMPNNVSVSNIKIQELTEAQYSNEDDDESMDSEDDNIMSEQDRIQDESKWTIETFTKSLIHLFIGDDNSDKPSKRLKQEYLSIKSIYQTTDDNELKTEDHIKLNNAKFYAYMAFALQKFS